MTGVQSCALPIWIGSRPTIVAAWLGGTRRPTSSSSARTRASMVWSEVAVSRAEIAADSVDMRSSISTAQRGHYTERHAGRTKPGMKRVGVAAAALAVIGIVGVVHVALAQSVPPRIVEASDGSLYLLKDRSEE